MPLYVVDLYRDILPKTNCRDCGFSICLAFAGMVFSEQLPIECQGELDKQHASGKWLKKDMAREALQWAREKSTSMKIEDLPERIGGRLIKTGNGYALELPYFSGTIIITNEKVLKWTART